MVRDPNEISSFSNLEGEIEQEAFDQYLQQWGEKLEAAEQKNEMRTSAYTDVVPSRRVRDQKPVNVSDGFAETKTYA